MSTQDVQTIPAEEAAEIVDPTAILRDILGTVRSLQDRLDTQEEAHAVERQEWEQRLAVAEESAKRAAIAGEMLPDGAGSMTADVSQISLRSDHPERDIEVKLDTMERLAKENGQVFDRERTKRVLLGQPVEDLNKFVFMGHAFDTEVEMEAYKAKVRKELEGTTGKYGVYPGP